MSLLSIFKRARAGLSRHPVLTDEAIGNALQLDYEGYTFKWEPMWATPQELGRLVILRHGVRRQYTMERPRSVEQLLSAVRGYVLDWVWQDFTEVAGLKREMRG